MTGAGESGSRPMIDLAVILLPEPDSPTIPNIFFLSNLKLTFLTALIELLP